MKQTRTFRAPGGAQEKGLMELIEKLPNNMRMIEIGSAYGESAGVFLDSGKVTTIYCIDPFADAERETFFDATVGKDTRVVKMKEKSEDITNRFENKSFDFVYIDAIHTYEALMQDIKNYLPKIKSGGWIGGHDYSHSFPGVIHAVFDNFTFPDYVFRDSSWLVNVR